MAFETLSIIRDYCETIVDRIKLLLRIRFFFEKIFDIPSNPIIMYHESDHRYETAPPKGKKRKE